MSGEPEPIAVVVMGLVLTDLRCFVSTQSLPSILGESNESVRILVICVSNESARCNEQMAWQMAFAESPEASTTSFGFCFVNQSPVPNLLVLVFLRFS